MHRKGASPSRLLPPFSDVSIELFDHELIDIMYTKDGGIRHGQE